MAIKFDTVDDTITCGTQDHLKENSAWSFSCWASTTTSGGGGAGRFLSKSTSATTRVDLYVVGGSGDIAMDIGGATTLSRRAGNGTMPFDGTWNNIIYTFTGGSTSAAIKIYKNGIEATYISGADGLTLANTSPGTIRIGNNNLVNRGFGGKLSEIALWNAVIGTGTIATLANARVRGLPLRLETANLTAYWPLDDITLGTSGDGDTFRDRAGTNTGTGVDGTNNTGLTGTVGDPLSYLLQNENIYPRGVMRGVYQ